MTGLPGCGVACKDDRTLSGLVCGSEKFTELSCSIVVLKFAGKLFHGACLI